MRPVDLRRCCTISARTDIKFPRNQGLELSLAVVVVQKVHAEQR